MQTLHVIDSHTGGEPTRVVIEGFPDLGLGDMAERREQLATQHDRWRRAILLEPRGHAVLVGALLCEPVNPENLAGVIFFNNTGYLGMCGHGTIGLVATMAHLGLASPGEHVIETPVGEVLATLQEDGQVSVRNVPAYRLAADVAVTLPSGQVVHGDIAWGGNWFFLCSDHGQPVGRERIHALTEFTSTLRAALHTQGHRGADGAEIDHIELFADDSEGADSRNFVLCPGGEYDRSPCGTGTSAKLACLAARGELAPGQVWRQASVIGSVFEGWYEPASDGRVIPTIRGRAHLSAEATLLIEDDDPFAWACERRPLAQGT